MKGINKDFMFESRILHLVLFKEEAASWKIYDMEDSVWSPQDADYTRLILISNIF